MEAKRIVLTTIFAIHVAVFGALLVRRRQYSLLLPISVFVLLIFVQVLHGSAATVNLGSAGTLPLPVLLRRIAWVLAVPSLGMMGFRIAKKIQARKAAGTPATD